MAHTVSTENSARQRIVQRTLEGSPVLPAVFTAVPRGLAQGVARGHLVAVMLGESLDVGNLVVLVLPAARYP